MADLKPCRHGVDFFSFSFSEMQEHQGRRCLARDLHALIAVTDLDLPGTEGRVNELQGYYPSDLLVLRGETIALGVGRYSRAS